MNERDEEYRKALGLGPDDEYPPVIGTVSPGGGRPHGNPRTQVLGAGAGSLSGLMDEVEPRQTRDGKESKE